MSVQPKTKEEALLQVVQRLLNLIVLLVLFMILAPILVFNADEIASYFKQIAAPPANEKVIATAEQSQKSVEPAEIFWTAPDLASAPAGQAELISYGKELIAQTAIYLGPKGKVAQMSNGMNCQNCHLDAGTKVYGNNYGSVLATYPKIRARSGTEEDMVKRVNDCFQRSLNGSELNPQSQEMKAIIAYISYLGQDVPKGEKAAGSGFKSIAFLDRAADPEKGKLVYEAKCQSCHQPNGEGLFNAEGTAYLYPPLWGKHSYNTSAGLYRMSNFAKYVKYNMPLGANHDSPQLTDAEAWDVAAYVNSQPRPDKRFKGDWPDIAKKPIDHPFGPYADNFSEEQHKFGPFKPIKAYYENLKTPKS